MIRITIHPTGEQVFLHAPDIISVQERPTNRGGGECVVVCNHGTFRAKGAAGFVGLEVDEWFRKHPDARLTEPRIPCSIDGLATDWERPNPRSGIKFTGAVPHIEGEGVS